MKNKKIVIFKRNKKSQIFSTLVVVFVFSICCYAFYLHLTNQPKIEREIIIPLSILDIYNQEQQINENNFNLLREAVHSSYIEMIDELKFISQNCQPNSDGFFVLGSICIIEDNADEKLAKNINSYLKDKNPDLTVSYSGEDGGKIVLESVEKILNAEEEKAFFPFKAEYKFKTKFSYPISTFYISSFSKIKFAVETCMIKTKMEDISLCLSSELPEMKSTAIKEAKNVKLSIKPKINLFNSIKNELVQPEIKLQISI